MEKASRRRLLLIAFAWMMASGRLAVAQDLFGEWPGPAEITATTGRNRVLIPAGKHGLNYFPDEVICILKEQPLTFTVVADGSYLSVEGNRRFTNDGVAHLSGCRKLSWLGLSYTGVSGDGMRLLDFRDIRWPPTHQTTPANAAASGPPVFVSIQLHRRSLH